MAAPPRVQVEGVPDAPPAAYDEAGAETASPARGAEMRKFLETRLQKHRVPPLVHRWDFWHDRQDRAAQPSSPPAPPPPPPSSSTIASHAHAASPAPPAAAGDGYEARLEHLATIADVKAFWSVFNNFDVARLALRDSIHLFHHGVKPVWEDARNVHGGSWTFRVARPLAHKFWTELCLLAIGEKLQAAVSADQAAKATFKDDICGVSLSVRFNTCLVQVWNRDGGHEEGVAAIERCVLEGLGEELRPREGTYYYKRHSEHAGFVAGKEAGKEKENAVTDVNMKAD